MEEKKIKGIIDLKDVDTDLDSYIEERERKIIEGKSIRQQIEENKRKPYDGILTEKMLLEFLEDLNTKKPYKDPTEGMSEEMAIAFHEAQKEYVKKNY